MSILVNETTKYYGEQRALDNVSFEIKKGEIAGFIGPNGAGKTTCMKIITGLIPQTSGKVKINGDDIINNSLSIREKIGYLPENNPLYIDLYVREYLAFVAGIYQIQNKWQRIDEIINITGLTSEQKKRIRQLSKGYRQRVGIAQALLNDPDVLILDEPTSGLDPNQIIEIRDLISKAGKEKTVLLSTHIMQEVEAICDRIIIINNGKIVANDKKKDIYAKASGDITIVVEFDREIQEAELLNINNVTQVKDMKNKTWLLQCPAGKDIRNEIFSYAVMKGYTVLSMQKKEKNLETVFQELTKKA